MSKLQWCVKTRVNPDITPAHHIDSNCGCTVRLAYSIQVRQANSSYTAYRYCPSRAMWSTIWISYTSNM